MKTGEPSQVQVSTQKVAQRDFMILCPTIAENSGVLEALYALYYLPHHYKLVISAVEAKSKELHERIRAIVQVEESFMNRVIIQTEAGLSGMTSPILNADVVVYGSSDPVYAKSSPQSIVVFDLASKLKSLSGSHNFAVATSTPEALASAILKVARRKR